MTDTIFIGIKGTVLAIERTTGAVRWQSHLTGSDFVNAVLHEQDLYAATKGRLYRLDPATGEVLWVNELPGMGWGILTIAGGSQAAAGKEKQRRDAQAAAGS